MKESQMQVFFRNHLAHHQPEVPEAYELKIVRGTSLPFDAVKEHQAQSLIDTKKGFFYKITDPPMFYGGKMRFNVPRPFDCIFLTNVQGYVVVWFYKPRQPKVFYKIPILTFMKEKRESARKSLTEDRAKEIGLSIIVDLKHGQ